VIDPSNPRKPVTPRLISKCDLITWADGWQSPDSRDCQSARDVDGNVPRVPKETFDYEIKGQRGPGTRPLVT